MKDLPQNFWCHGGVVTPPLGVFLAKWRRPLVQNTSDTSRISAASLDIKHSHTARSLQHQPVMAHQEVRSHILILSDPNGSAHVGWAEMYDGRFIPALKTALEEDDDENGGIQQIVRCAMKTVVAACEALIQIHWLGGLVVFFYRVTLSTSVNHQLFEPKLFAPCWFYYTHT